MKGGEMKGGRGRRRRGMVWVMRCKLTRGEKTSGSGRRNNGPLTSPTPHCPHSNPHPTTTEFETTLSSPPPHHSTNPLSRLTPSTLPQAKLARRASTAYSKYQYI
ncbi:MAG: hypothetical protein ACKESB_02050 [Candidatus Hodgkinia cicadicola]